MCAQLRVSNLASGNMLSGVSGDKAYKSMGNSYIRFARDYPEFFKTIFMQKTSMNSDDL